MSSPVRGEPFLHPCYMNKQQQFNINILDLQGCDIKHDHNGVNNDESRCEDIKMSQNGGNHAIRRRKLPLKKVLPTFFGDLPFWGRYVGYMSALI